MHEKAQKGQVQRQMQLHISQLLYYPVNEFHKVAVLQLDETAQPDIEGVIDPPVLRMFLSSGTVSMILGDLGTLMLSSSPTYN